MGPLNVQSAKGGAQSGAVPLTLNGAQVPVANAIDLIQRCRLQGPACRCASCPADHQGGEAETKDSSRHLQQQIYVRCCSAGACINTAALDAAEDGVGLCQGSLCEAGKLCADSPVFD